MNGTMSIMVEVCVDKLPVDQDVIAREIWEKEERKRL
jgi:hypothetical protein